MKYSLQEVLAVVLFALILSSCEDLGEGLPGDGQWAIYRLSDPTLVSHQVRDVPVSQLSLAEKPFISIQDLRWYRWDSHTFECLPTVSGRIDSLARFGRRPGKRQGGILPLQAPRTGRVTQPTS